MGRVLHFRIWGLGEDGLEAAHARLGVLIRSRSWSGEQPELASVVSTDLFSREFLDHVRAREGDFVQAAGFLNMGGDETDALVTVLFLRDLSADLRARALVRDEDNPLTKLRHLEFTEGRLPSGNSLEEMLARRPVIKKVDGQAILFYPPAHRLSDHPGSREEVWGYGLMGLRAYAPTLVEAEGEALKFLRAMRRLGR